MRLVKLNQFLITVFLLTVLIAAISCSGKSYSKQEAIKNFKTRKKEILAVADYFTSLKTDSREIFFEPDGNRYTISVAPPNWAVISQHPYNAGRDMKINSLEMDSLLRELKWSTRSVLTLKEMLINANCKSISSDGDYINLDYGTGDICSFWYIVCQKSFPDSLIEKDTKSGVIFLAKNVRIGSSCAQ